MNCFIRPARLEDAGALGELHYYSRIEAYKGIVDDSLLYVMSLPERIAFWEKEIAQAVSGVQEIFVAEGKVTLLDAPTLDAAALGGSSLGEGLTAASVCDAAILVGFVALSCNTNPAEIDRIYVAHEVVGRGIGKALMNHALQRFRSLDCTHAMLWVFNDNARARRFYEAVGFLPDGNVRTLAPYPAELRYSITL